jgi:hypothetical protein
VNKDLKFSIAWGAGIIGLALAGTVARRFGFIDDDALTRIVLGATGLMVAWYGNRMPKAFYADNRARQIARVGGWSWAISGVVYAALWVLAPIDTAVILGCGAIILGALVTLLYGWSLKRRPEAA